MPIGKYLVAAGLTVLWPSCAWAGIYIAPLDGLKGVYSTGELGPVAKTVSFDFGQRFERIESVEIHVEGTIAPGLWSIRSLVGDHAESTSEIFSSLDFFVHPAGDYTVGGAAELREDGAFDTKLTFSRFFTSNWAFLKDGRGDLDFQLWGPGFFADVVARQIVPSLAGISSASLIVEGQVVPEPAGMLALILSFSATGLRRWRRG